jgi:hypothetical protein
MTGVEQAVLAFPQSEGFGMILMICREFPRLFSYSQLGANRLGWQRQASEMVLKLQAGCLAEAALLQIPTPVIGFFLSGKSGSVSRNPLLFIKMFNFRLD